MKQKPCLADRYQTSYRGYLENLIETDLATNAHCLQNLSFDAQSAPFGGREAFQDIKKRCLLSQFHLHDIRHIEGRAPTAMLLGRRKSSSIDSIGRLGFGSGKRNQIFVSTQRPSVAKRLAAAAIFLLGLGGFSQAAMNRSKF